MAEVTALLNNPFERAQLEAELKGQLELSLRFNIEGQIVRRLIEDGVKLGTITVNDGEEDVYVGTDVDAALAACFSTDEDWLYLNLKRGPMEGVCDGWVRLIYGNSGWDVMNDWTASGPAWVEGPGQALELSKQLEGGHVTVTPKAVA